MLCGGPEDESTYFAGFPKEQVSADRLARQHHLR